MFCRLFQKGNVRFLLLPLLFCLSCFSARAASVYLHADFEHLNSSDFVGSSYSENGILFSAPSDFRVVNGNFAGTLFGGGFFYDGRALNVACDGWVGISVPGSAMSSVSFLYGFDWNFYMIEFGLMDTIFEWQAFRDGELVGSQETVFGRDSRTHGGFTVDISLPEGFDLLLIRSRANAYEPLPGTDGWLFDRGEMIGYGDANRIAFDNVSVRLVPEPSGVALVALGLLGFAARRFRNRIG